MEQSIYDLNEWALRHRELQCPEYAFQLVMNPWQHPEFNQNIHHLFTLVLAFCNTCGGVIFLTTDTSERNKKVTNEIIDVFKMRLTKLIHQQIGNVPSEKIAFTEAPLCLERKTAWAAIHVKRCEISLPLDSGCRSQISEVYTSLDGLVQIEEKPEHGHVELGTSPDVSSRQEATASTDLATERPLAEKNDKRPEHQHAKEDTPPDVSSRQEATASAELTTERPPAEKNEDRPEHQHVKQGTSQDVSRQQASASAYHTTERTGVAKRSFLLEKSPPRSDDETNTPLDFSTFRKLDWSKNKKDWEGYVHGETPTIETVVNSCSLWKPATPMMVTPDKETLGNWFGSQEHMEKTLHAVDTKEPGFAVVCKTWKLHILNTETELRPPEHICDILTVSNKAKVCLWVICSNHNEETVGCQMEYLLTTGRMIKYQLVHAAGYGDLSNLCIECRLFCPNTSVQRSDAVSSAISQSLQMQMCIWKCCTDEIKLESLQNALAWTILLKESPLKRSIGKQTAITLSEQQVQVLHNNHRVNYVSGPAGSGKSYTAALLCQMYGKDNSVYICTTAEFVGYLEFSGYQGTLVQKDKDLLKEIKDGTFTSKQCIIIDDSHNFTCTKSSMKKLFKLMNDNRQMSLFVFADNDYQSFDKKRRLAMSNCIRELSQCVLGKEPHYAYLTVIYRNTKKVASFVQAAIQDSFQDSDKIECQNVEIGDGIECIRMKNIWLDSHDNDLANYIRTMADMYKLTEIAVLLDPSYTTDQIDKCRRFLRKHIPDKGVQSAEVFPREGVVVDSVTSFLGLDAPLCLFILRRQKMNLPFLKRLFKRGVREPDASISNPCFKVFMATRATHKAVFVVPKMGEEVAKELKFDVFHVPQLVSLE